MTTEQFSKFINDPDSDKSCIDSVATFDKKTESGSFCISNNKVSKKFWLRDSDFFVTENEESILNSVKYKAKTFGKNKKAKRAAIIVISIIRKLAKDKFNTELSRDIIGKLLNSNDTANNVLNALIAGDIIQHNNFSNRAHKVARKWRFTDTFKNAHLKLSGLRQYLKIEDTKKKHIVGATKAPQETFENFLGTDDRNQTSSVLKPFSKQIEGTQEKEEFKIDFLQESVMIFEEITPTSLNKRMNTELNQHDEYQQKLIVQSLSPYFKKRFASFGLDIYGTSYCDCCKEMLPNALFSVSNSGILNRKCKMCYDIQEKSSSSVDPLIVAKEVGKFAKGLRKGYVYAR